MGTKRGGVLHVGYGLWLLSWCRCGRNEVGAVMCCASYGMLISVQYEGSWPCAGINGQMRTHFVMLGGVSCTSARRRMPSPVA